MNQFIRVGDGNCVIGYPEYRPINNLNEVSNNNDGSKSLRYYIDEKPLYNINTERLINNGYTVNDTGVFVNYTISQIPSGEISLNNYNLAVASGYDTGFGFKIRLEEADRAVLTQGLNFVNEGLMNGYLNTGSYVPIKDYNGVMHQITVLQYKQIWFMGGAYYTNLWVNK